MSKKYQFLDKKRKSSLYEGACDIVCCKFKTSNFYTSNCSTCLNRYIRVGRTRREQQIYDKSNNSNTIL
jgi:hypothetical protein